MKINYKEPKKSFRENIVVVLLSLGLVSLCLLIAHQSVYTVDYVPINGTFQNYNAVRRLLDGQVPYRDFSVYLGLGHLYIGSVFTYLFGNDFQASMMAFSFLTILCVGIFAICISKCIWNKKTYLSLLFANILLLCIILQPSIYTNGLGILGNFVAALNTSLSVGNSARFIRGLAPFIMIIFNVLFFSVYRRLNIRYINLRKHQDLIIVAILGGTSGIIIYWSNDYGIASYICMTLFFIGCISVRYLKIKKIIKMFSSYFLSSVASFIVFGEMFTFGNLSEYLNTILGTGGYQSWYYGYELNLKSFFIYDVDFSFLMLLQLALVFLYVYKIIKHKADNFSLIRYGVPGFVNLTAFTASNEYKLLSGSVLNEIALTILYITIICEVCSIMVSIFRDNLIIEKCKKVVVISVLITLSSYVFSAVKDQVILFNSNLRGTYVKELGGYLTHYAEDLTRAKNILEGDKIFSTYASALEVMTKQYQPTGTDYIIHVLGDSAREKYLEEFENGDFIYAATMKPSFSGWEYWIRNANWFFYRELLENYTPKFSNSYEMFWSRKSETDLKDINSAVDINYTSPQNAVIQVTTEEPINGTADVTITYKINKNDSFKSKLMFQTMAFVDNTSSFNITGDEHEKYFLPGGEVKKEVPITIVNGVGSITITSEPEACTWISDVSGNVNNIFTTLFDYIDFEHSAYVEDGKCKFAVVDNQTNRLILQGANAINIGGHRVSILDMVSDGTNIIITLDLTEEMLEELNQDWYSGNCCKVVRE